MDKAKLNDGNGLYDNAGLCDTILSDLNGCVKLLLDGKFIQFCAVVSSIAARVVNLKKGIENDRKSLLENIEELKRANSELQKELNKDGVNNGTD